MLAKFNLVENMTALSLKDLAEAFPQVSPAAKAAGIDLVFLSGVIGGMRQSGLNATESAHALKFALQRMVNPTSKVVALSEELGAALGSEFHKDLGIGNMMLFKLAENMQLIKEQGSDEEALVYLGELVGKRQASRIYATTLALRSFGENVSEVGQIFSRIGQVDIGNRIAGTVDDKELRAQFASIFCYGTFLCVEYGTERFESSDESYGN
jgi:TP901 family phage tail tape measure protein